MTKQEAISVLESINAKTDYFLISDDARAEAIDMAISALKELKAIKDIIEQHDRDSMPEDYWYIDKIRTVVLE